MTELRFHPSSERGNEDCEIFLVDSAVVKYLQRHVESYGIAMDVKLLEWLENPDRPAVMPSDYDERVRQMLPALWSDPKRVHGCLQAM